MACIFPKSHWEIHTLYFLCMILPNSQGLILMYETSFGIIKQVSPSLCLILLLSKPRRLKIGQLRTCLIKQGAGETAGYVISVPFYYTAYEKHSEL